MRYLPANHISTEGGSAKPGAARRIRHFITLFEYPDVPTALKDLVPELSSADSRQLMKLGAIYVEGAREYSTVPLGSYVRVHLKPRRFRLPQCQPKELAVFVDDDFVIAKKPAGLPTHATVDNLRENLIEFLQNDFGPLFPAQRLDHGSQGLVTLARSPEAHRTFQHWQKTGRVRKKYLALTNAKPPLGRHQHWMEIRPKPPHAVSAHKIENAKSTELEIVKVEAVDNNRYLVEIDLITGRTHQIRAQLAALGCPLVGDSVYGGGDNAKNCFFLACVSLQIPLPSASNPTLYSLDGLDPTAFV